MPTSCFHKLWFFHVTQQQLSPHTFGTNSPIAGSRAASTRKPGNQIHQMFTPKVFMGRIFMGSSSLERWVCKHPHQLHGSLGHSICTHTSPSTSFGSEKEVCSVWPLPAIPSLSSPFTHHPRGLQAVRQKCHLWLCPSQMNSVSLKPYSKRPPQPACVTPIHPCVWPPRAAARLRLCEHTLYTWPIILAISPTSVQLQQSWIGPCSPSETATAYSWSSDSHTMKPFTRLINSWLCIENNCVIWVSDLIFPVYIIYRYLPVHNSNSSDVELFVCQCRKSGM